MKPETYRPKTSFIKFLRPFAGWIFFISSLSILANGLNLIIPTYTASLIDELRSSGKLDTELALLQFGIIALGILILTILQILLSSFASEKVAAVLRKKLVCKISEQDIGFVNRQTPSRLLTNLTSDIDAVKGFISHGFAVILSAILIAFGATFALVRINSTLAVAVLIPFPIIVVTFLIIFKRLIKLFSKAQGIIDKLNTKITESIFGASLIRVVNSQQTEMNKFDLIARLSRENSSEILKKFGLLLPLVNLIFNVMIVSIIYFGGLEVINQNLSIGEFQAFYQYAGLLITPVFILGFVSGVISRSLASYNRIAEVIETSESKENVQQTIEVNGNYKFKNLGLKFGEKEVLKDISFDIKSGTKVAIIGPTGAGKSLLVNLMLGLEKNFSGEVLIEDVNIKEVDSHALFERVSVVFQDSIIFNSSIRENITLGDNFSDEEIMEAIRISELEDIVKTSNDLENQISERGTSLSGGQKQRLTLSRAIIRKPKVLILDDFTARVDIGTESRILRNIFEKFNDITLISVTQKIEPIINYDQIILIMEGELIATGQHKDLITNSFEYKQIYESQRSVE
jgi:ATP-binding cassette subfamily B protein